MLIVRKRKKLRFSLLNILVFYVPQSTRSYAKIFFMSRKVTQRFFLCLAKNANLRKGFFYVSQSTQSYAKACLFISRKARRVSQRLVYYILCGLSELCAKLLLCLAEGTEFRKGLFIIFFVVLASFARNLFYVLQRVTSR